MTSLYRSLRQRLPLILIVFSLAVAGPAQAAESAPALAKNRPLTFGVVPQQAASKLARLWTPILEELGRISGTRILFKTAPSIPSFEKRLANGDYDLAYMNPYHFTVFNDHPGYLALGKQRDKQIHGILVVRADAPIKDIKELNKQRIAFPAPAAFAASVLPRAHLRREGILIEPKYVSSHDSVYRAVAKGLMIAGGGIERTFNNVDPAIRDQLRILWRTDGFTPHAIAAHPRLSADLRNTIREALISLSSSDRGKELLKGIGFKGIEKADNQDWDDVRSLGIDLLNDLAKN